MNIWIVKRLSETPGQKDFQVWSIIGLTKEEEKFSMQKVFRTYLQLDPNIKMSKAKRFNNKGPLNCVIAKVLLELSEFAVYNNFQVPNPTDEPKVVDQPNKQMDQSSKVDKSNKFDGLNEDTAEEFSFMKLDSAQENKHEETLAPILLQALQLAKPQLQPVPNPLPFGITLASLALLSQKPNNIAPSLPKGIMPKLIAHLVTVPVVTLAMLSPEIQAAEAAAKALSITLHSHIPPQQSLQPKPQLRKAGKVSGAVDGVDTAAKHNTFKKGTGANADEQTSNQPAGRITCNSTKQPAMR
ncbi:hypothetical protein RHS01_09086 [Rhizoctonia solani]|uniref:Uncharacterized protein n=1 Tax=Rhizoctonia solani TaxID=456999 RepID=A0A8H7I417_9AGAM|nr:hypothetical protein RHS01_09086 [Rhizoctonia solani]